MRNSLTKRLLSSLLSLTLLAGSFATVPVQAADENDYRVDTIVSTDDTTWRYLDDNTDPAGDDTDPSYDRTSWTAIEFDDSDWNTAKGSFGAKSGILKEVSGYMPNTLLTQYYEGSTNTPAFFFRTEVELSDIEDITALNGTVIYDDAALVYINGHLVGEFDNKGYDSGEPFVTNLEYGGSNASTPKTDYFSVDEDFSDILVEGTNVISVELHNGRSNSSDLYVELTEVTVTYGEAPVVDVTVVPENVILMVGADETERLVAWYGEAEVEGSYAYISSNEDMSDATAIEATTTASINGYYGYEAAFSGIKAGTYYYQVSCGDALSEVYSFTAQDLSNGYNFLMAGDVQIGTSGVDANTAAWQLSLDNAFDMFPDTAMILCVGDQVNTASNEEEFDGFMTPDYLREVPVAVTIGNHDVGSIAYSAHYAIPNVSDYGTSSNAGVDGSDFYFVQGNTLFMSLNSNNSNFAEHQTFMEEAIAAVPEATWKVVYFHHAPYSAASHADDTQIETIRDGLPPIFTELGIDLVLNGHDHVYTRSYLMNGTTIVETEVAPASGDVLVAEEGQVLYITANTASNSKFYSLITNYDTSFAAIKNQESVPNITNIEVTDDAIVISTYRSNDDMSLVDEVTLTKAVVDSNNNNDNDDTTTTLDSTATVELTADFQLKLVDATDVATIQMELDLPQGATVVAGEEFNYLGEFDGAHWFAYLNEGNFSGDCTIATITGIVYGGKAAIEKVTIAARTADGDAVHGEANYSTDDVTLVNIFDVNGDGSVNILDLTIVTIYYLADSDDENWNDVKQYDFNDNGLINITDFTMLLGALS